MFCNTSKVVTTASNKVSGNELAKDYGIQLPTGYNGLIINQSGKKADENPNGKVEFGNGRTVKGFSLEIDDNQGKLVGTYPITFKTPA